MDQFQGTIGQRIAQAARACEQRRTKHGRDWVAAFLSLLHRDLDAKQCAEIFKTLILRFLRPQS